MPVEFNLVSHYLKGRGGHAAIPDKNVDPVLTLSHVVTGGGGGGVCLSTHAHVTHT